MTKEDIKINNLKKHSTALQKTSQLPSRVQQMMSTFSSLFQKKQDNFLEFSQQQSNTKQISLRFFYIAIISKMLAKEISERELDLFMKEFPIERELKEVRRLFSLAHDDKLEGKSYAVKIVSLYGANEELYKQLIILLLKIAAVESYICKRKMEYIINISRIFGCYASDIVAFMREAFIPKTISYYELLGITKEATKKEINMAYKNIARLYHPDKYLQYKDVSKEYIEILENKFALISQAYGFLIK